MKTPPILATLLLTGTAVAQLTTVVPPQTRGMLSAIQMGVVFDHDRNTICRKGPGLPAPLYDFKGIYGPTLPEFSTDALETWITSQALGMGGQAFTMGLQLDAMTSVNDFLPLVYNTDYNGQGEAAFQIWQGTTDDWAALFFSIETAQPGSGGDIHGYYFKNPGFRSQLRNKVYTEILGSEFLTGTVPAPPAGASVAALDSAMGMLASSKGKFEPSIVESRDRMCFSLTPACALALWDTKIPALVGNRPAFTGGTIFEATYGASGQVIGITVEKEHTAIGLDESDDIDALAIGTPVPPAGGMTSTMSALSLGSRQYVFSLDALNLPGTEQLMVHATVDGKGPTTEKLRTETGNPLVGPAGTLDGDVKGACAKDPEVLAFSSGLGIPEYSPNPLPVMSLSLHAQESFVQPVHPSPYPYGVDNFDLTGVLSGWGTSQPHAAMVFVAVYHQTGMDIRQLPSRTAQQDVYEFSETYLIPFNSQWSPNAYRVVIATLGTSPGHQNLILESLGSWLVRKP